MRDIKTDFEKKKPKKQKLEEPKQRNLPSGFHAYKGRCSFDAPQKVWAMHDFDEIEICLRTGEVKVVQVFEVNWAASFLKTDVIGWREIKEKETMP